MSGQWRNRSRSSSADIGARRRKTRPRRAGRRWLAARSTVRPDDRRAAARRQPVTCGRPSPTGCRGVRRMSVVTSSRLRRVAASICMTEPGVDPPRRLRGAAPCPVGSGRHSRPTRRRRRSRPGRNCRTRRAPRPRKSFRAGAAPVSLSKRGLGSGVNAGFHSASSSNSAGRASSRSGSKISPGAMRARSPGKRRLAGGRQRKNAGR